MSEALGSGGHAEIAVAELPAEVAAALVQCARVTWGLHRRRNPRPQPQKCSKLVFLI